MLTIRYPSFVKKTSLRSRRVLSREEICPRQFLSSGLKVTRLFTPTRVSQVILMVNFAHL
jgi:hypothetical protein